MCYSHDGSFIITAGEDNKIIVWDVFTGKQFSALLGHQNGITGISLHPDGIHLISSSTDSTVKVWDLKDEKCVKTIKHTEPVCDVAFSTDGKEFLVGEKTIYRYTFPEYKKSQIGVNALHGFTTVDYSPSGKYIAFGGERESKGYLYNDSLHRLEQEYLAKITEVRFDLDESSLFYTTTEGHLVQCGISESFRKSTTTDWMLNSINSVELTDSLIFISNDRGEINIIDKKNWANRGVFLTSRQKLSKLILSKHGQYLATAGDNRAVLIWDLKKKRVVKVLKGLVNRINDIAFSKDGQNIIIGYADGEVRTTNLLTNISMLNHLKPKSKMLLDRGEYSVSRINRVNKDTVEMEVFYARKSLEREGVFDKLQEHDVTWLLKDNVLAISERKDKSRFVKNYLNDSKKGIYHKGQSLLRPELLHAESEKLDVKADVDGEEVYVKNFAGTETKYVIISGHSDIISAIAINERYGFLCTASWDGMIRFWDLATGDLLTIFGAFGKGQFVYLNSDNYYFASKHALDYIGFKFDDHLYSFDQFDLKYNRPDLIVEKLPYFDQEYKNAYFKAYKKRLSKMGVEESDLELTRNIPRLEVERVFDTSDDKGRKKGRETEVKFRIKASDELTKIDKLHIKINGVPEYGIFGKSVGSASYDELISLKLTPGANYVQFNVINDQGVSSFITSFNILVRDNDAISNLYVISIGSSKFGQQQYNLTYAEKDAMDISVFFEKNHKEYDNCFTKTLVNEQITRENVENLKEFLKNARENDVVILFAAGHGVLDRELDYYFSAYDMDFENPSERGIPYDVFEQLMANTKSRKKVMFLDACHSGEIDKDEVIENFVLEEQGDLVFRGLDRTIKNVETINSFDLSKTLFADMRMNSGTTVISSAGGAEFAIEGEQWGNSVFTYSLLNGLKTGEADLNNDKEVRLSELQEFILFEVNKLTKGMQTPTSRAENLKNDFTIQ